MRHRTLIELWRVIHTFLLTHDQIETYSGLCVMIDTVEKRGIISLQESNDLLNDIYDYGKTVDTFYDLEYSTEGRSMLGIRYRYYWPPYVMYFRLVWVKDRIKQLSKENSNEK